MSNAVLLASASTAVLLAVAVGIVVPPRPRLPSRLTSPGADLGHPHPEPGVGSRGGPAPVGVIARLFGPPSAALLSRLRQTRDEDREAELGLRLRRAGTDLTPEGYRLRVVRDTVGLALAGAGVAGALLRSPLGVLVLGTCGAVFGASRWRGRVDRLVEQRRERLRLELVTINHLLAIHVRTGAGAIQAAQRIVARGRGVVVEELGAVLDWVRSGASEGDALRRAAELTAEPSAARTYRLLATGAERGVDLARALRACSDDLRDQRRDAIRRGATRRRAAMLIPTIVVLAPVMLLFIAAPLPTIVLGGR